VDYCAANSFLDAFAREHARRTGTFTVAINWGPWQQVGMAVETNVPEHMARHRAELLKNGITPDDGIEVFRRILALGSAPQIVATPVTMTPPASSDVAATQEGEPAIAVEAGHDRPDLAVVYAGPTNDLEEDICAIWQDLLGIQGVGIHDNFFDLGGHSLLATQLTSRMRRAFEVDLSLKELFDAPTVAGLAELLMAKILDQENSTLTE
jgi:acyl carrier protein